MHTKNEQMTKSSSLKLDQGLADAGPLISIVVPAYNVQAIVGECVRSILAQTHRKLEVIAVDDRSTDDTGSILDGIAAEDGRLKVLHLPENIGLHAARGEGLRVATGAFIGFVDGDDIAQPTMFAKLLDALIQKDADIAICGFQEVHAQSRAVQRVVRFPALEHFDTDLLGRYSRGEFRSGVMWNKLYKRELLLPNAMMTIDRSADSGADYIVGVGCFAEARRVVVIPDVELDYLSHPKSMSRASNATKRFVDLLHFYVTSLEVHRSKRTERYWAIDELYARQFRFDSYRVGDKEQFAAYRDELQRSLIRLAEVHPEGIHALMQVHYESGIPSKVMPLRYSLGQVRLAMKDVLRSLRKE